MSTWVRGGAEDPNKAVELVSWKQRRETAVWVNDFETILGFEASATADRRRVCTAVGLAQRL